ncbi:hypothetical protein WN943_003352 [Citrus x changshan-huyou]
MYCMITRPSCIARLHDLHVLHVYTTFMYCMFIRPSCIIQLYDLLVLHNYTTFNSTFCFLSIESAHYI